MTPRLSNYETAKSRTTFTPQPRKRQYIVCTKCHSGWEWVSNNKTHCREPGGGGKLANPKRSSSPARRRGRSNTSQQSSRTETSSVPTELLPLLQDKLAEFEVKFPDIAKSVKELAQPAAPAAALHGAQSACQIAFRELQAAETQVSEHESEANELVAELREKVRQLNDSQAELAVARTKYEEAAKTAQSEVQKHTKVAGDDHVHALITSLEPDKLQQIAASLAEAAKTAREKATVQQQSLPAETQQHIEFKPMEGVVQEPQLAEATSPQLPTVAASATAPASSTITAPMEDYPEFGIVRNAVATDVEKDAALASASIAPAPASPPLESLLEGGGEPPAKAAKKNSDAGSVHSRRSSHPSARSGRSRSPQRALQPQHFAGIADSLEAQIKTATSGSKVAA